MTAPGWADDGNAHHLVTGLRLPSVALRSTQGGTLDPSTLGGPAIVYVYPWTGRPGIPNPPGWDDIPGAHGSTPQAGGLRDHYPALRAAGWDVWGLSSQTTDWQREFATRLALPFALLSDAGFDFADALRLPRFSAGGVAYLKRLTLLVRDGRIVEAIYPVSDPAGHAGALLARHWMPTTIASP